MLGAPRASRPSRRPRSAARHRAEPAARGDRRRLVPPGPALRRRGPAGRRGAGRRSSTTTCCRGWPGSTRRCWWSSAAPPARASPPWSTAWSGRRSAPAGVLRPTTRAPVLVCNPTDTAWFRQGELLPGLIRTAEASTDPRTLQLVAAPALGARPGVPRRARHRLGGRRRTGQLAAQLLAAADLWLFVTTAARYADAVPWELLRTARLRGTVIALVLDRVPPEAAGEVTDHLRRDARRARPGDGAAVRAAGDHRWTGQGLLPERAIAAAARLVRAARGRRRRPRRGGPADPRRRARRARTRPSPGWPPPPTSRRAPPRRWTSGSARRTAPRCGTVEQGRARRPAAARRGARPLAGVRRHRRVPAHPGGPGRPAARPGGRGGHRPPRAGPASCRRRSSPTWSRCCAGCRGGRGRAGVHGAGRPTRPGRRCSSRRCGRPAADLAERAERLVRDWQRGVLDLVRARGRRQAVRGARRRVRGQRHRPRRHDRGVRRDRVHPDRRWRSRSARRHHGRRAEGARGDLRRPGHPHAGQQGPRGPARRGSTSCSTRRPTRYLGAAGGRARLEADPGGDLRARPRPTSSAARAEVGADRRRRPGAAGGTRA